jgi:peptidoglycan/LPS O-acetylase OafA/YrhL
VAVLLGVTSLVLPFTGLDLGAWFLPTWWMFCTGMILCWRLIGTVSSFFARTTMGVLGIWCVVMQLAGHADPWGGMWTAWLTGVGILGAVETSRQRARVPAWLLYCGSVSYSLYLVHLPVIEVVNGALYKVTGDATGWAVLSFFAGAVASFAAAHVLLVLVERPAIGWTRALRPRREAGGSPGSADPPPHLGVTSG